MIGYEWYDMHLLESVKNLLLFQSAKFKEEFKSIFMLK